MDSKLNPFKRGICDKKSTNVFVVLKDLDFEMILPEIIQTRIMRNSYIF